MPFEHCYVCEAFTYSTFHIVLCSSDNILMYLTACRFGDKLQHYSLAPDRSTIEEYASVPSNVDPAYSGIVGRHCREEKKTDINIFHVLSRI